MTHQGLQGTLRAHLKGLLDLVVRTRCSQRPSWALDMKLRSSSHCKVSRMRTVVLAMASDLASSVSACTHVGMQYLIRAYDCPGA